MDLFDSPDFWSKIDEEKNLQERLVNGFKDYDFILDIKSFPATIEWLMQEINNKENNTEILPGDIKSLANLSTGLSVLYFSMYSTQLSFEDYFYKESAKLRGGQVNPKLFHPDFHPIVDHWKKSDPVLIVKAIRNRFQHGRFLKGNLLYSVRTEHHEDGAGKDIKFTDSTIWTKIDADPKLKEAADKIFPNDCDKLKMLSEKYLEQCRKTVRDLCNKFDDVYATEMAERRNLLDKLDGMRDWFEKQGVLYPWPHVPIEPEV